MKKKDSNSLLEPGNAVENYLDTLLQESTGVEEIHKPLKTRAKVVLLPELDLSIQAQPESEKAPLPDVDEFEKPAQPIEPVDTSTECQSSDCKVAEEDKKSYDFPMQCLMFRVGNSQLSIPLIDLANVQPWVDNMTQIPQAPEWFAGLLKYRDSNVKVADSARLLNIELQGKHSHPSHILVLGEGIWAISCDQIGDVIALRSQDIQWSSGRSHRNLALGTIKQSLAQLLDPDRIISRLNQSSAV